MELERELVQLAGSLAFVLVVEKSGHSCEKTETGSEQSESILSTTQTRSRTGYSTALGRVTGGEDEQKGNELQGMYSRRRRKGGGVHDSHLETSLETG